MNGFFTIYRAIKNKALSLLGKELSKFLASNKTIRRNTILARKSYCCLLEQLFRQNRKMPSGKIKIHFIYLIPSFWPSIEAFYNYCSSDERIETKVIYLRMQGKYDCNSLYDNAHDYILSKNYDIINYEEYHLEAQAPDVIVYQIPYRRIYNTYFPKLHIEHVKKLGICTVYISYGVDHDISRTNTNLQEIHYGLPVQETAWRIYVFHNEIREMYYRHCLTGGAHVRVLGHPRFDARGLSNQRLSKRIIEKAAGRRIISYQIHFPNNIDCNQKNKYHTLPLKKTWAILAAFTKYTSLFFIVTFHPLFRSAVADMHIMTEDEFTQRLDMIEACNNMLSYTGPFPDLISNSDGFITENSSLMFDMLLTEKPILYLYDEPVMMLDFAEDIVSSLYHGNKISDVENFINTVLLHDQDSLVQKRWEVKQRYFEASQNCCEHIKNDILHSLMNERFTSNP